MLEIRKNTFSKNYENTFFRDFSRYLFNAFKEKNLSGVLIGSPFCEADERLQIDALLITPNVVCIIDFKNYSGKIKLPPEREFELGLWMSESGEQIKGGSSINPFVQLKNQRKRFYDVSIKHIIKHISKNDTFNPSHTVRAVCFHEEVELSGKVPPGEALTFFILNKVNFLEVILDIIDVSDKEVQLSENSYDAFKKVFRADLYKFDDKPLEDKLKEVASKSTKLDFNLLHEDQRTALTEIKSFLESDDQRVFILQGTINSGKSFLIPYIQEVSYSLGKQETEVFAASHRIAKNLISSIGVEKVNSIYSFIYGGLKSDSDDSPKSSNESSDEIEDQNKSDEILLEKVPLKKCDNSDNSVFIVDESQLVSDSYHQTIDLVFGSGRLLNDFISFSNILSSKRKIIFIGDPYQLHLGGSDESPLNPAYLEEVYKLKVSSFQLLDKPEYSETNKQALSCVEKIKSSIFSSLRFSPTDHFRFLSKEEIFPCVSNILANNINAHILNFSNEEAQIVNLWIKNNVTKSGEDIASKDLVLFHNNISVEDINDPFAEPKKIFNGQFATVISVSDDFITESINLKSGQVDLKFREIALQLSGSGNLVKVLSLENYRLNAKAELSKNEMLAYRIILNNEIRNYTKANAFEKSSEYSDFIDSQECHDVQSEILDLKNRLAVGDRVKGKLDEKEVELRNHERAAKRKYKNRVESALRLDPSSKYYKYKNAAFLKFGWAITVNRAMSFKWDEVIFNIDPGKATGKSNQNHFRWLYTGISRAKQKVYLINYHPITPFDKTEFCDNNSGQKPKDIFFISENPNSEERLVEFDQFITSKLASYNYSIKSQLHSRYQLLYTISDDLKNEAVFSIYFNDKGRFKFPQVMNFNVKEFSESILSILRKKVPLSKFDFITDEWRRHEYSNLQSILKNYQLSIEYIIQRPYRDTVNIYTENAELNLVIDYTGTDKSISKITAKYYDQKVHWEDFEKAVGILKS